MSTAEGIIELKIYERLRRFGTKARTKGPGHAKSVVKLYNELQVGSSVFSSSAKQQSNGEEEESSDSSFDKPSNTVLEVSISPESAVLTLDKFEKRTDNAAFGRRMQKYSDEKQKLLHEYGVKDPSGLTEAGKASYKARLAKSSFYYWEYQMVISYADGKRVHSTKLKSVTKREFSDDYIVRQTDESNEG